MKNLNAIFILLLLASIAFSQYEFTASVQNQDTDGTNYTFNVYMVRTGTSDIYLGDSDFAFDFDASKFTNPVASVTGAAERIWNWYSVSASIVSGNIVVLNIGKPNWNDQTQFDGRVQVISTSGNGTLIGSIQITNVTDHSGTAGLTWRTLGQNTTKVNNFDSVSPWAQSSITASGTYTPVDDYTLPVTLLSFTSSMKEGQVELYWQTTMEVGIAGFFIDRSVDRQTWERIADWRNSQELKPKGLYNAETNYSYCDETAEYGILYYYRLGEIDLTGHEKIYSSLSIETESLPKNTQLNKIYPNPFNPQTTIHYQLASATRVKVDIYDLLGRKVRTLVDRQEKAGLYNVLWDGLNANGEAVASGIYHVHMQTEGENQVRQVSLLR